MRLAAIDIGTNSVHMIVVQVRPDFSFEVIDREKEMVRLGAGGLDGKKLTREAMTAALQALSKFERLAKSHQVDEILAVATSATREAENGGAFLKAIERKTGVRPRIITGTEEARLIHLAAVYGVDTPKAAVVIDIGGGSVEITLGSGREVKFARSFKIGVIRLTEHFVESDPISDREEKKMTRFIGEQVDRYIDQIVAAGFDRAQERAAVLGFARRAGRDREDLVDLVGPREPREFGQRLQRGRHRLRRQLFAVEAAGTQPDHLFFAIDDFERKVVAYPHHDHVHRVRADVDSRESHGILKREAIIKGILAWSIRPSQ